MPEQPLPRINKEEFDELFAHVDKLCANPAAYKSRIMKAAAELLQERNWLLSIDEQKNQEDIIFYQRMLKMHAATSMLYQMLDVYRLFDPVIISLIQPAKFIEDMNKKVGDVTDDQSYPIWKNEMNIGGGVNITLRIAPASRILWDFVKPAPKPCLMVLKVVDDKNHILYKNEDRFNGWHEFNLIDGGSVAICIHSLPGE